MTREERLQLYNDIAFDIAEAAHQIAHFGRWTKHAKALLDLGSAMKHLSNQKRFAVNRRGSAFIRETEEEWQTKK